MEHDKILLACYDVFHNTLNQLENSSGDVKRLTVIHTIQKAQAELGTIVTPNVLDDICYAWIAWADDQLMNLSWPGQTDWQQHPLQLEYFQEQTAGDGFFTRLERLQTLGHTALSALLVYHYCLEMKFQGRYRLQNTKNISEIIHHNRQILAHLNFDCQPPWQTVQTEVYQWPVTRRWLPTVFITLVLCLWGFTLLHLKHQRDNLYQPALSAINKEKS